MGQWSSDRAKAKFRAKEAVLWQRATRQPEAIDVATQFGSTRAYHWPGAGTPIVFLHGMTDTSVRWIPYADALDSHDVYAIDILGDVGHSEPDIGFTTAADYATWLGETLDALGIAKPHIVGASLGGFIALSYAMKPEGVASLVGFEPVGIVDLKLLKLMSWSVSLRTRCSTCPKRSDIGSPPVSANHSSLTRRQWRSCFKPSEATRSRSHPVRSSPTESSSPSPFLFASSREQIPARSMPLNSSTASTRPRHEAQRDCYPQPDTGSRTATPTIASQPSVRRSPRQRNAASSSATACRAGASAPDRQCSTFAPGSARCNGMTTRVMVGPADARYCRNT